MPIAAIRNENSIPIEAKIVVAP
ncbi:hypothetical protein IL54_3362 [Sphingobium sp. ba1]|nr:hypothetical protein IL54_3362 [Sphingobium sp. ba1]